MASSHSLILSMLFAFSFINIVHSISFNFPNFTPNMNAIHFQGDAFSSNDVLQLTKNQLDGPITSSTGRASYAEPLRLWDKSTGKLTDFTTHFSFVMKAVDPTHFGDGISFFLLPFDSQIPNGSTGGFLALFNSESAFNTSKNQIVAVEFDSFNNTWDPTSDHVGINVNSIESVAFVRWKSSIKDGRVANAWVDYNSSTKNLSVFLTYADNPVYVRNSSVSYVIDLREVLPEWVRVGFSAATGDWIEIHNIISWSFNSSLESDQTRKSKFGLGVGLSIGFGSFSCVVGVIWFTIWRRKRGRKKEEGSSSINGFGTSMDDEFEKGTGPRRFTYKELSRATNDFAEAGKLGEGGFGDHELGSQTTILAGTMGYLAPECVTTGKASKESDVYSFGVVALEITCGRRPVELPRGEAGRVRLVEWVWELYGKGKVVEAADERLRKEYDEKEMEWLMIVGLWCCHPDQSMRPSIRQVINVLNFEAALPSLPPIMPVPMYYAPPMEMCRFSYTSGDTGSTKGSSSSYSSMSAGSRKSLL
ncbi:L-type lectin-domain containing receptor kinase IX.1-like [Senna tora]|uniref:non-specific serine/threonine protein kinase n=1 Tax=Senna tora TaxID=362788 RepID=A0A834STB4_9FABA|nr:L-type lectin-domain containing receptor kinase IX.1-like [Senna tora]